MPESEFNVVTAVDNPNLRDENSRIAALAWPEFMLHDPVARFFTELYDYYPQHQFGLADEATGETMCIGNSVPLACGKNLLELPDEGWDWALEKGIQGIVFQVDMGFIKVSTEGNPGILWVWRRPGIFIV